MFFKDTDIYNGAGSGLVVTDADEAPNAGPYSYTVLTGDHIRFAVRSDGRLAVSGPLALGTETITVQVSQY